MPELPEVETIRTVLESWTKERKVSTIKLLYPRIVANSTELVLNEKLAGNTIEKIERRGKYLIFVFADFVIVSHLRMEGKYYLGHYPNSIFQEGYEYDPLNAKNDKFFKHVHVIFELDNGSILMYHDSRKFGRMFLLEKENYRNEYPINSLGFEPFELDNGQYLFDKFQKLKVTIKQALLMQDIMCGLGNIYVDEVLFDTKISPLEKANNISLEQCDLLVKSSVKVLNKAIYLGGSTIKSYHPGNDVDGRFQNELMVYGHENERCSVCGTMILKTIVGTRGTHYCPYCQQKNIRNQIRVIGVTGLIGSGKSSICQIFAENGYLHVDADSIAKKIMNKDQDGYLAVVKEFGSSILDTNGNIDRALLRKIIIVDDSKLQLLNNIIHPLVVHEMSNIIKNNKGKIVLDVPLLYESNSDKLCDAVVFVNCNSKVRKSRLIERGNMPVEEALKLNSNNDEVVIKSNKASYVVDNTLDLQTTRKQVLKIIEKISLI